MLNIVTSDLRLPRRQCVARRTALLPALCAAALVLAGCSNTSGQATVTAAATGATMPGTTGVSNSVAAISPDRVSAPASPATPDVTPSAALKRTPTSDPGSTAPGSLVALPTSSSTPAPPTNSTAPPTAGSPDAQSTDAEPSDAEPSDALPDVGLAGVNDPTCHSADRPVVLLHGTFSTVAASFHAMVPALLASGRCLYGLDYGFGGIGPVRTSAADFADVVRNVEKISGATKVDVVAYSQGGLVLRTALRLNGLADQVATAVLIAPSFHGTTTAEAAEAPAALCPGCADQVAGSALLKQLDAGGDLDGSVRYAVVSTRNDTVVTPMSSQIPRGPADRVRSIVVEDQCPNVATDHIGLPAVPGVIAWTVAALQTAGRPAPTALTC